MTLHFSHIGLTEGRTFTFALSYGVCRYSSGVGSGDRFGRRYRAEAWHAGQTLPYGRTEPW
jgi:hypothetical protein